MKKYQRCNRCIMDTTDPLISFNEKGICNHCEEWDLNHSKIFNTASREQELRKIFDDIKYKSRNKRYDAIIGLSGGIDSSYLAYIAVKKYKLRLLAIHVDGGWNSEESVHNIESLTTKLGIDLFTHVVQWQPMKELQLAYLKSGVANQDVPQDHAFFVALYSYATQHNIKYVLNGSNLATEAILPKSWGYRAMDSRNLRSIFKNHGKGSLRGYPTVGFFQYYFYYRIVKGMKIIKPLNYINYHKEKALKELINKVGYKPYGAKHHESRFTKWFQSYYLPKKFGYDKRKAHLSSMILSSTITREKAIEEINLPPYQEKKINVDSRYIAKKLGISESELMKLVELPNKDFSQYSSYNGLYNIYFKYFKN